MPYIPSKRRKETKVVNVQFEGDTVQVAYHAAAITPRLVALAQELQTDVAVIADVIQRIVVWWDVLDDEGNRIPPTPENTMEFDVAFLGAVVNGVFGDMAPGEATAVESSGS